MSDAPPPTPPKPFGAPEFAAATGASPAQVHALEAYRALLADWNERINLVGPSALAEFWRRHALDSAQLLRHAPQARVWADIGAGAGFPGVVLAVLLQAIPGARVHLIESMAKRCRFLEAASEALALRTQVHNARAEQLRLTGVQVVTARACAPMPRLLEFAAPYLRAGAVGLFLKGRDVEQELTAARRTWRFDAHLEPSDSDPSGRVVRIERLTRV